MLIFLSNHDLEFSKKPNDRFKEVLQSQIEYSAQTVCQHAYIGRIIV